MFSKTCSILLLASLVSFVASESGICSWYDAPTSAYTANGEHFNPNALTAAHKTLPFNTYVRARTDDGREVTVRINDRGPFVAGRILDVTPAGADRLNLRQRGIAKCTIATV